MIRVCIRHAFEHGRHSIHREAFGLGIFKSLCHLCYAARVKRSDADINQCSFNSCEAQLQASVISQVDISTCNAILVMRSASQKQDTNVAYRDFVLRSPRALLKAASIAACSKALRCSALKAEEPCFSLLRYTVLGTCSAQAMNTHGCVMAIKAVLDNP